MVRRRCCCFVALLMILSVSVEASTHRILVDTDADSDDLFAILYLLKLNKSEFDLQGITVNANLWSNAGHAVNHIYDILYMMDRDDIPVGVGGEGGILEDGTIMPDVGGFFPLIDQGMSTAGGCRYRQSVPVGSGSQLRVDTNFGIRKGILPQVNNRDLSIAVLREFIKRRKQEHGAMLLGKRNRGKKKKDVKDDVVEDGSGEASNNGVENGEKMNLDCGNELEKPVEEEGKEVEGNGLGVNAGEVEENKRKEIKPARVLEALSASGLRALRYAREVEVEDLGGQPYIEAYLSGIREIKIFDKKSDP